MEVPVPDLDSLDGWINESIRRSVAAGYNPTVFLQMRERHGTKGAMKRLIISGEIQSGFVKLRDLGLLDWSVEAGILKFSSDFSAGEREAAQFRLAQARKV